jgi:hypothetical protein
MLYPSPRPRQLARNERHKTLQRLGARDHAVIHAEAPTTGHASASTLLTVPLHGGLALPAAEAWLEGGHV